MSTLPTPARHFHRWFHAAAAAILLLPLSAQETIIREVADPKTDTHVEVVALFSQPSKTGCMPFRVTIANNLRSDRSINLDFTSSPNYGSSLRAGCSYQLSAGAGKTVTRDLLVPICASPVSGRYSNITVALSGSLGNTTNSMGDRSMPGHPDVLLSAALQTPNGSALDSATSGSGHRSGSGNFGASFNPKELPTDWLAFSGYDSILMTDSDWTDVPPGSRNAILSWLRLGGHLVIYTTSPATPASLRLPADAGFGSYQLADIAADLRLDPKATVKLVKSGNPVTAQDNSKLNDYKSGWPLQISFGSERFHYGVFIAVLVVFGILVGPVNLFVFAKSGRRHRLFITTPIISLATSLILIGLIIFQDGFGGEGIRRILMEVRPDSGQNAAFLHQEQFCRTGILTGARFTVDPACNLSPVPIAKTRWSRYISRHDTSGTFNLQPVDGGKMNASGDWFQSRSEHGHVIDAVLPTRGRIEATATPLRFVSTFDFPIQTLFYLDETGQWHRAENVATGKPVDLTPVDATMAMPKLAAEAGKFARRNRELFNRVKNRRQHFVAITNEAPGIDTLPGIRWKETRTVITGPVFGKPEAPES